MSLRRADNVRLIFKRGRFGTKGELSFRIGATKTYWLTKMSAEEFESAIQYQTQRPWAITRIDGRTYWHFANQYFWDNENLDADSVYALLVTRMDRQRQQVDRARQMVAMGTGGAPRATRRGQISDDVKQLVWMRDEGRCRACGSAVELQFDHIIPVAMGGGSSPENLQLLCGPCNRRKGVNVRNR